MKLTRSKFNEMIPDEIDALYEEKFTKVPRSLRAGGHNMLHIILYAYYIVIPL